MTSSTGIVWSVAVAPRRLVAQPGRETMSTPKKPQWSLKFISVPTWKDLPTAAGYLPNRNVACRLPWGGGHQPCFDVAQSSVARLWVLLVFWYCKFDPQAEKPLINADYALPTSCFYDKTRDGST